MSVLSQKGFILNHEVSRLPLTDRSGRIVLFTDYEKFKEYAKKRRLDLLYYRCKVVRCKRYTKSYLVI